MDYTDICEYSEVLFLSLAGEEYCLYVWCSSTIRRVFPHDQVIVFSSSLRRTVLPCLLSTSPTSRKSGTHNGTAAHALCQWETHVNLDRKLGGFTGWMYCEYTAEGVYIVTWVISGTDPVGIYCDLGNIRG